MKNKRMFRRADAITAAAVILTALIILFITGSKEGGVAHIIVDGTEIRTSELSGAENELIELENGVKIIIEDGTIRFLSSDCPSKDCVACGRLSSDGDIAVCIPNKTIIKITGGKNSAPDIISY